MKENLRKYHEMAEKALLGGGEKRLQAQQAKGKLTVRQRLDEILDKDTFIENQRFATGRVNDFGLDKQKYPGDGVVAGAGQVDGRQIFVSSQDFTVLGGSLGEMQAKKIAAGQELALKNGCPYIQINDSGGARIQEGIFSLNGYAGIFKNNTLSSGVIPQFSLILGPCAGGAVYSPAITDFVFMVDKVSHMYITGPDVIKAVTGENVSHEDLGGAHAHAAKSGIAHFVFSSEAECFAFVRRLLSYLPANNMEKPPLGPTDDPADRKTPEIESIIPEEARKPYDVRQIIGAAFDRQSFLEVHAEFAKNVVVGFARLNGRTVGIFANQPQVFAAAMDIDCSDKGARFIRFCDCFNIPVISLVDVPGYLPGTSQEYGGIIRHGAKILYAITEATVPKISLIMRKSYGGSMIAMSAKALGYDRVMAYPNAEIAVMGAEGAANVIFRKEIEAASDPESKRKELIDEYRDKFMNPWVAASHGFIDDVIEPQHTRQELIRSLEMNIHKQELRPAKKHGNIPL